MPARLHRRVTFHHSHASHTSLRRRVVQKSEKKIAKINMEVNRVFGLNHIKHYFIALHTFSPDSYRDDFFLST
jgi:hypothetical protein